MGDEYFMINSWQFVFRFSLPWRVRGSVWPVIASLFVSAVGVGNVCRFRYRRAAKRNGAIAGRFCLLWRVALLIVSACICGLPGVSLMSALAGCPFIGNHCAIGTRVVVNHGTGELFGLSLITALAGNQCTIPFCRKSEALNRQGGHYRQSRH